MRWCWDEGCNWDFGTVAVVPPLEMVCRVDGECAPPLEMLCNWVECGVALQFYVAEVNLTLKVDFCGPILKSDCRGRPR